MYIEVCGTDEFDYEYRKKIYYKNGYRVAFIQVYKEKWKNFLVNMIMDIEDKRHAEVMKMTKALNFYIIARFQHVWARATLKQTTIKKNIHNNNQAINPSRRNYHPPQQQSDKPAKHLAGPTPGETPQEEATKPKNRGNPKQLRWRRHLNHIWTA